MYLLIESYLERLPGAMKEEQLPDGSTVRPCMYTPHSLRATTATLLLDANVDIIKVKDLVGHRHVTTTQIYDKRRRSTSESASHLLAIKRELFSGNRPAKVTALWSIRRVVTLPPLPIGHGRFP